MQEPFVGLPRPSDCPKDVYHFAYIEERHTDKDEHAVTAKIPCDIDFGGFAMIVLSCPKSQPPGLKREDQIA